MAPVSGFDKLPFTQKQLHAALREMCPLALKGYSAAVTLKMRTEWTPENPTRFTCYMVSECIYWFCAPHGSRPMTVVMPNDSTLHRYVLFPDNTRVDVTCDQFGDEDIPYEFSKERMFLQTGGFGPSKRAQVLAKLLDVYRELHHA